MCSYPQPDEWSSEKRGYTQRFFLNDSSGVEMTARHCLCIDGRENMDELKPKQKNNYNDRCHVRNVFCGCKYDDYRNSLT